MKHWKTLKHPIDVCVGDGRSLKATGRGIILLKIELLNEKVAGCSLCSTVDIQLTECFKGNIS